MPDEVKRTGRPLPGQMEGKLLDLDAKITLAEKVANLDFERIAHQVARDVLNGHESTFITGRKGYRTRVLDRAAEIVEELELATLKRADDYQERLRPGVVRIFQGHPGYCMIAERHEPHLHEYVYASGVSGKVSGRYQCKGEAAKYPPLPTQASL